MSAARGFTAIPNHVLRDAELTLSARVLYGVILSYAWGKGVCTASSKRLCDETGIGRSAFFEAVASLRERELIEVSKRRFRGGWRNVYLPVIRGGLSIEDEDEGRPDSGREVVQDPDGGSSARRTEKKTQGEEGSSSANRPRGNEPIGEAAQGLVNLMGVADDISQDAVELLKAKTKVGGKMVTQQEMGVAAAALDEINSSADRSFSLGPHLTAIVGRVREHPSWDAAKHRRLVQSAFRFRWWERNGKQRRLTPAVIYGNERVFENCVQDAHDEASGRRSPGDAAAERPTGRFVRQAPVRQLRKGAA
jgi:hypothetical protein